MDFHEDRDGKQGCTPTPGMLVGLGVVFLWIWFVVPAYQRWRYPPPPAEQQIEEGQAEKGAAKDEVGEQRAPEESPRERAPDAEGQPAVRRDVPAEEGGGFVTGQATAEALAERVANLSGPPAEKREPDEAEQPEPEAQTIEVETDDLIVEFSTLGASIESAYLRTYHPAPKDAKPLPILMPLRARKGPNVSGADLGGTGGEARKVGTSGGPDGAANSFVLRPVVDIEGKTRGVDLSNTVWKLEGDTGGFDENDEWIVTFATARGGFRYRKRFILHREGHVLGLEIEAENVGSATKTVEFDLVGPNGIVPDDVAGGRKYVGMLAVLAGRTGPGESLKTEKVSFKRASEGDLSERGVSMALNEWVAVKNRYFTVVCQAEDPSSVMGIYAEAVTPDRRFARDERLGQENVAGVMRVSLGDVEKGFSSFARFQVYLGPAHGRRLRAAGGERGWEELVDFGWFGWLSKLLLGLLNALHLFTGLFGRTIGGYGLAVLFLTLAVKGAMFPVMRKSMISMHRMQKLAPEVAIIKKRYEGDKSAEIQRKMQMEIMELYKKHNVSMLGGCLPMFIQLPMFISLYGMLRTAFELRHEPYLWISDLTQSENLVTFGVTIPIINWTALNLLPFAYLGLTLLQQHLQPKPADPQAAQQQKMMKFMMIFIFLLFYNMPSGLVLYFVFSNAFGILEQWIIRRHFDDAAPVAAAGAAASVDGTPVGTGTAGESRRKTAWDKQDEKQTRRAEKRKKKRDQRDRMGGPGTTH